MVRLLGSVLALLSMCLCARAESVVLRESAPSPMLDRPYPYLVYLPDGYDAGSMRYPVLYLLHGAGGDEMAWAKEGHIKATADRLIADGAIPPAIIVMPGCRGCWWVDGAVDKAETAFWSDLVPDITRRYRVIDDRRGRLVAGLSAGGFGAVRFAMNYPDRFVAAAALSPAVYADAPPEISSARRQPAFHTQRGTFDLAAWKARNYPAVIERYFGQTNRVAFYLTTGDQDKYGITFETVTLFKHLYQRQPELTELRVVDGDHSWSLWSRAIEGAMRHIFRFADRPQPLLLAGEVTGMPAGGAAARSLTTGPPLPAGGLEHIP